jgi:predicted CoA-binding protein
MVDIFRNSEDAAKPAIEAIEVGARFVWMQLGVVNEPAAAKVREAGLEIVMDHCPAIEYPRLMGGSTEH